MLFITETMKLWNRLSFHIHEVLYQKRAYSALDSRMKSYIVFCLICMLPGCHSAQNVVASTCTPAVTPDLTGSITSNSVVLQLPSCCFNSTGMTCNQDTCQIWLVASLATGTFDADKSNPGFLTLSPYPSAFVNSTSKSYFLTYVSTLGAVPCPSTTNNYFVVGADGQCSAVNCNGVLPVGSNTRYKYLLVDSSTKTLLAETKWSDNITLYTPKDPGSLGGSYVGRSAAMIVITAILSAAAGLLLLCLLIGCLLVACGSKKSNKQEISPIRAIRESFRIPRYDTHNLNDPSPYDNPLYEPKKRYTTAATLPKTETTTVIVVPSAPDNIKLQNI
ncbi:uroplakin-3b [Brachyhypopomus gauderio]|uniref:uroplakin-3b n=1 Tax=Brachyhypopomus gauderio TaxID=698409 RepID=UPI004041C089